MPPLSFSYNTSTADSGVFRLCWLPFRGAAAGRGPSIGVGWLTWTVGIAAFPGERPRDRDLLDDLLDLLDLLDFLDSVEVLVVLRRGVWVPDGALRDDDDGRGSASASGPD